MKISGIGRESSARGERVAAHVVWEACDRPARRIFFEVPSELGEDLSTEPESFAVGCAVPAMSYGERRLAIEGSLCPRVRDGLLGAGALLRSWHGESFATISIEASEGFRAKAPASSARSALFLSGGIDSLYALASNRADFPLDHPASFRDALIVRGFSFFPPDTAQANDVWRRSSTAVRTLASAAGVVPIPITTNLREIEPDFALFARYFVLLLAAAAHALARRVTTASIAADLEISRLFPWGSHPLLHALAGSSAVDVVESGGERTRLEKTRALARHPELLATVVVCQEGPLPGDVLNCGRCEKCVRTLVALMIAGVPESGRKAFAVRSADAGAIDRLRGAGTPAIRYFWSEIVAALDAAGLGNLADAGRRLIERSLRAEDWHAEKGWRGRARRFDRLHLNGSLLRASRGIRALSGRARSASR
jgi:hypothetical protein